MKFRVAMDSAGELSEAFKGKDEYRIVPLTLMIGDEEIIDDGTINQKILIKKIADSPTCAKTACPSPEAYFREYDCGAEHVYGVTISAELSGSFSERYYCQRHVSR